MDQRDEALVGEGLLEPGAEGALERVTVPQAGQGRVVPAQLSVAGGGARAEDMYTPAILRERIRGEQGEGEGGAAPQ